MKILIKSVFATIILFTMAEKNESVHAQSNNQSQKPLFTFGIIADIQYSDYDPVGTRYYRSSPGKLREALSSLKRDSAEFLINLGDLIDRDFNSYKPVMDIIDSSGLKTYHVAGNHDYSIEERFKKRIPVVPSSRHSYYSFVIENFRFILLNGNEVSTYISTKRSKLKKASEYLNEMKSRGAINAVDWNGGVGKKQIKWLEDQLNTANRNDEKVLLICHFPLVPDDIHNLLNCEEVLNVLGNYNNIIAWLNGHNHAGNYVNFNEIHFITFKGMVETNHSNSFAMVEVYDNKIWIRGYGREKSRMLAY